MKFPNTDAGLMTATCFCFYVLLVLANQRSLYMLYVITPRTKSALLKFKSVAALQN